MHEKLKGVIFPLFLIKNKSHSDLMIIQMCSQTDVWSHESWHTALHL